MPVHRALALALIAAAVSAILSVGIFASADPEEPGPRIASVAWSQRPDSVAELRRSASIVVEAEVKAVEPGPELVSDHPAERGAEHRIPTQRVTLSAVRTLDGRIPGRFKLFKTGSDELRLADDPEYRVGERYVLFLVPRDGEPGTYLPPSPDGRLRLNGRREAEGTISGRVDRELSGLRPDEIATEIRRSR